MCVDHMCVDIHTYIDIRYIYLCVYIYTHAHIIYTGKDGAEVLWTSVAAATEAVSCNGMALQHARLELRADKGLVMAAVRQCGAALQVADKVSEETVRG